MSATAAVCTEVTRRHACVSALLDRLRAPWFDWVVCDEDGGLYDQDDAGGRAEEEDAEWEARMRVMALEDPDSDSLRALLREREEREEARHKRTEAQRIQRASMPTRTAHVRLGLPLRAVTRHVLGQCAMALHLASVSQCLFVEHPDADAFLGAPSLAAAHVGVSLYTGDTTLVAWLRLEAGDMIPFLSETGTAWHISVADGRRPPESSAATAAPAQPMSAGAATSLYTRRVYDALVQGACVFVDSFARHAGADDDARAWLATWRAALNRLLEEPLRKYHDQVAAIDPQCSGLGELGQCLARTGGADAVSFVVSRRTSPYLVSATQQGAVLRAEADTLWKRAATIGTRPGEATLFGAGADEVCMAVGGGDAVFSRLLRLGWLALALSSGAFSFDRPADATPADDARAVRLYNACALDAERQ